MRKLSIHFNGETGIDGGGLTNKWFNLVIQSKQQSLYKKMKSYSFKPSISPAATKH